jgi:hypothetical protein
MGKGNWIPYSQARYVNPDTYVNQVYVDLSSWVDEDDFDSREAYEVLKFEIHSSLSESFSPSRRWSDKDYVLSESRHTIIVMDSDADLHHQGIGVVVNPEAYERGYGSLAERSTEATFRKIVKALRKHFPNQVYVRTSAWTSSLLKDD